MIKKIKPNKWLAYSFLFIPIIFYFILKKNENDIWFILAHGREVLTKGFPHIEFLSIHKGLHFIMPQWLSSVIFYGIYKLFGFIGLYLFVFLVLLLLIYLVLKLCLIISNNKLYISCIVTSITVSLFELIFITPRPHIFTYLILVGVLIIMELYIRDKKDLLYLIPILSVLQVNFHASMWPIFFIFIMPFVAELFIDLIKKKNKKIYKLIIIILISILVGIINPYGIENMIYAYKSYGNNYINKIVNEMHPINLDESFYSKIIGLSLIAIFSIINIIMMLKRNKKNKIEIHEIFLIYGTFFMALLNKRNYGLFFIASIPFTSKYFNIKDGKSKKIPKCLYAILTTIFLCIVINSFYNKFYIIENDNEKLVNYLNKNSNKNIKIYTNYNDGNYYEFHGYKSYIDTRAEVYTKKINKKEDILEEYYNLVYYDYINFIIFDNKYKFDYYVVEKIDKKLIKILEKNNFKKVVTSKERFLYRRNV